MFCYCVIAFISIFFFFKQKTAYEMRISDWSSDVCSSDLQLISDAMDVFSGAGVMQGPNNIVGMMYKSAPVSITVEGANIMTRTLMIFGQEIGRASCRERVCQYV